MFTPGDTTPHTFIIPFSANNISTIVVTYTQKHIVLEKDIDLSNLDDNVTIESTDENMVLKLRLTQEESLLFENNACFCIQLNVLFDNGIRISSDLIKGTTGTQCSRKVV